VRKCILAIDQGTTNTKVVLFDERSHVVAESSRPVPIEFPQPGWVQQDPRALWQSVRDAVDDCLSKASGVELVAVGLANQRESVLAWDRRTGEPLGPCIGWQCKRTVALCEELRRQGVEPVVAQRTGLGLDPLFSATKARWLLDHIPDGQQRAEAGELCLGTVDSWVLWNLTGGRVHATDVTNASRTLLFNLHSCQWDEQLLEMFGIPRAALPAVQPSSHLFGETVGCGWLPGGILVSGVIGDSHGALFGHGVFGTGTVKATYGTGSSLMTPVASLPEARDGVSATIAWGLPGHVQYALEGNILVTGGAVEWIGRLLNLPDPVTGTVQLALSVPDSGGVYFVPALAGLGAPFWDPVARGILCGLTRATTAAHLARAALEAIAFQVAEVFRAMEPLAGTELAALRADGGASQNDWLMQFQADILNRPVIRSRCSDLAARGAAWLAGLAAGLWSSLEELGRLEREEDLFEPRMPAGVREALWEGWRLAVARARLRSSVQIPGGQ